MAAREKKKWLIKLFYQLIFFSLGIAAGVVFCNWSYFVLDKSISILDVVTIIISSGVAIYIGNTIQKAVNRGERDYTLLVEQVRIIVAHLDQMESWTNVSSVDFNHCLVFFKKGSILNNELVEIFGENDICDIKLAQSIKKQFIDLKRNVTAISPINNLIHFDINDCLRFENLYRKIRKDLILLIVNFR